MVASAADPQTLPERLISWTIGSSWWLWLIGGLYFAGPILGWTLVYQLARDHYFAPVLPPERRPYRIPWPIWCVVAGMIAMEVILLIGHANFNLDAGQTIKSSVGWAKGWALLALFPLAGAGLHIRPEVIYHAVCRLGRQTLIATPLLIVAALAKLPQIPFVSPLKVLGGSSDEFFAVVLYTIEPGVGTPRWQFYAPWSPAAGLLGLLYLLFAIEEKNLKWKLIGLLSSIAIILMSQSRLSFVALAFVWPFAWLVSKLKNPKTFFALAPLLMVAGWFGPAIINASTAAQAAFAGARIDSTRVRNTLGRIAVERWHNEAYWFGHGIVERGPHIVEYMPIGSHHSWYGLLFVKGLTGAVALGFTLAVMLFDTARSSLSNHYGRMGFAMVLVIIMYSFGENLEVLAYLMWPALVLIGVAMRSPHKAGADMPRSEFLDEK
jgi:hypothetical protein